MYFGEGVGVPLDRTEKARFSPNRKKTETPAFKKWFKGSKVVDENGVPQVMYHWSDNDFSVFDMSMSGEGAHFGTKKAATDRARGMADISYEIEEEDGRYFVVADSGQKADEWQGPFASKKEAISFRAQQPKKIEPMALYLSIKNPIRLPDLGTWNVWDIVRALPDGTLSAPEKAAIMDADDRYAQLRNTLLDKGIDGVVYSNAVEDKGSDSYIAFDATQIKSAIGNNGQFDPNNPDIRRSTRRIIGDSGRQYTPEQKQMFKVVGRDVEQLNVVEKIKAWANKNWAQGLVDQFDPIKALDKQAYALARLSKGATGAFEAFMHHGKLSLKDGAYDADTSGGVMEKVFFPLGRETTDFLYWIAGNRAERLILRNRFIRRR